MIENKKYLYEKIMYNISKNIKHILYENNQNFSTQDYQEAENELINNQEIENMTIDDTLRIKALATLLDRTEKTAAGIFNFIKKHENDNISEFFTDDDSFMQQHGIFILFMIAAAFENVCYGNLDDQYIKKFENTYKIGSFNPYNYSWFEEDDDVDYLIELLTTNRRFKNIIELYIKDLHNNVRNLAPGDIFEIFQVWPEPLFKGGSVEELEDIIENGYY